MSVRFLYFEILKGEKNELLNAVVATLNTSFVKDTTALGLLRALAWSTKQNFEVLCEGDYYTVANAQELREDAPEPRDLEWFGRISDAVDRKLKYKKEVDDLLKSLPNSPKERKEFLERNKDLLINKAGGYYTSVCIRQETPYDGGIYENYFMVFGEPIELDTYEGW